MNRIAPGALAEVGKYVSEAPDGAISLGVLARQLGVGFMTARRRLEAYAAANGLTLQSERARVGVRGPEATTWYLRPPAEPTVLIDSRVRLAFMAALPRDLEDAVPRKVLLKKVLEAIPREVSKRTSSSSFSALLSVDGVVTTSNGLVYLERAAAKTQSVAAIERREKRRQPSPRPSPPRGRGREVVTRTVPAIDGSDDAALGLSPEVFRALKSEELLALRLLARTGTARTSELVLSVGHSPDRVAGMMSQLRRKLHELGAHVFVDEDLPDGETMFRYLTPEER